MGREDVYYDSQLEWLNGKLIEGASEVAWYCEHYPKAAVRFGNKIVVTVFDMLICYYFGGFELQEVKYVADSKPKVGTRTWWQLEAQKALAKIWGVHYEIADETIICSNELELDNLKQIVGWLIDVPHPLLQRLVLARIEREGVCSIGDVVKALTTYDESSVIMTICYLLHRGDLEAPLADVEFSKTMLVWRYVYGTGRYQV